MIKHYTKNTTGRDISVGDIHGCFSKVQRRLDEIGFNPEADRLFSVGDLVDRGPESMQALDWIAKPWFHAVRGNHEDMAIRWGKPDCQMDAGNYAANGGGWNISNSIEQRGEVSQALAELPLAIEVETVHGLIGIVHAACPCESWSDFAKALSTGWVKTQAGLSNSRAAMKELIECALWSRTRIQAMDDSITKDVHTVIVGHTPMRNITSLGNTIFIDTAGWHPSGAGFTLLDLNTLRPL